MFTKQICYQMSIDTSTNYPYGVPLFGILCTPCFFYLNPLSFLLLYLCSIVFEDIVKIISIAT